jgi:tetratricopeptide (TPR) repeat protein
LGNLPVRIGALEGIADCHRRHGHYDQAIQCANDALAVPRLSDYPDTDRAQNIATSRSVTVALKLGRWYGELARTDDAARLIEEAHAVAEKTHDAWLQASYLDGRADMLFDRGEFDEAEPVALAAEEQALQVRDRITLLQARTTLCLIYLKTDRTMQAHRAIRRAWHYRRTNRSLVVLALLALTTRQKGDRLEADRLFRQLFAETTMRIELDEHDFAAWDFHGFAICGTHLDTQDDLDEAVSALRFARSLTSPAPVLVARLRFMVEQLDRQDRLRSAIDALSDPR